VSFSSETYSNFNIGVMPVQAVHAHCAFCLSDYCAQTHGFVRGSRVVSES
jgi:hypothetical protein